MRAQIIRRESPRPISPRCTLFDGSDGWRQRRRKCNPMNVRRRTHKTASVRRCIVRSADTRIDLLAIYFAIFMFKNQPHNSERSACMCAFPPAHNMLMSARARVWVHFGWLTHNGETRSAHEQKPYFAERNPGIDAHKKLSHYHCGRACGALAGAQRSARVRGSGTARRRLLNLGCAKRALH